MQNEERHVELCQLPLIILRKRPSNEELALNTLKTLELLN